MQSIHQLKRQQRLIGPVYFYLEQGSQPKSTDGLVIGHTVLSADQWVICSMDNPKEVGSLKRHTASTELILLSALL